MLPVMYSGTSAEAEKILNPKPDMLAPSPGVSLRFLGVLGAKAVSSLPSKCWLLKVCKTFVLQVSIEVHGESSAPLAKVASLQRPLYLSSSPSHAVILNGTNDSSAQGPSRMTWGVASRVLESFLCLGPLLLHMC